MHYLPNLPSKEMMAPVSAWRYISPKSATTGAAAVCTLIRLSPDDDVYLFDVKKFLQKTLTEMLEIFLPHI